MSKAHGLNASQLRGAIDNTEIYRLMYGTLFGTLPPDLLLVDEPTASLDPKTARQIMRLITELAQERRLTVLLNMHDVPLAQKFAQRIVGLKAGRIVYDGFPDQLTTEVLTEIYGEEDGTITHASVLSRKF